MDLKPPKAFVTEGNLEHNWKTWKNELDLFMVATEASEKSSKIKSVFFCTVLAQELEK